MREPNSQSVVSSAINVYKPGPLPVINAVCEEIGLVDVLNQQLSWDETQCLLSPGDAIKALIMNCLTEGQPMYRLPEFFQETDTENLFGEDIDADHLNDHRLGRALDSLSAAEPSTVLGTVLLEAASREDISTDVVHADTTSFSVQGHYDPDEDNSADEALSITHGFSKDNRPDLKQFNIGLGVNQTGVPVFGQILDGNASDKTWNTDLIGELRQWLDTDELPVYVADSAAVTKATLDEAAEHELDLISRLPATYSAVDTLIDRACEDDDWTDLGEFSDDDDATEYKLQTFQQPIHDHELRCLVVHSSSLADRASQRIDDDLDDTEDDLEDAVVQLGDRVFSCEADAEAALDEFLNDHDGHCFDIEADVIETEQKKSRDQPGRPPKDWEPYETVYKIAADVHRDAAAITERKKKASCFVVVTTLTDTDEWSAERVLDEYKNQQAVERRFPVLKDPKRVGPVFLDRPDRVEALGYVLLMALLVYSLIERRARLALQDEDEPMELAGGPTSFRPTGRRVLERFENMLVLEVDGTREIPDNVTIPERVLDLLGLDSTIYGVQSDE
jgi:transposase